MKKKFVLAFIICIGVCVASLCGCGSTGADEAADGADSGEAASTQADDGAWKAAYLEVLQGDQDMIEAYTREDVPGTVALNDLNGDGTPELLYFVRDDAQMFPYMKVWTFADGSAQQISYHKAVADDSYSDLPVDALYDYEVQGGTSYMVFKTKDGNLQMSSFTFGAENSPGATSSYKMDGSELTETLSFGFVDSFLNSMLEQPEDLNITYSKDGKEIYEDEYMELLGSCSENLEEVIFATKMPDGVMEIDPLWLAAEGKDPSGMTYDDAVQRLGE